MTAKSLKTRLAAKKPRRVSLPVQVTDPGREARETLETATRRLALAQLLADDTDTSDSPLATAEKITEAEKARDAAQAAMDAHYEFVEFEAVPPADFEKFSVAHTKADGELDDTSGAPALAALCAVDEGLRDEAWWTDQLTTVWTIGERTSLWSTLVELNYWAPSGQAPKG